MCPQVLDRHVVGDQGQVGVEERASTGAELEGSWLNKAHHGQRRQQAYRKPWLWLLLSEGQSILLDDRHGGFEVAFAAVGSDDRTEVEVVRGRVDSSECFLQAARRD